MSDSETSNPQKSIKELYEEFIYYPIKVFEIFKDFFGEERVDLQDLCTYEEFKEAVENNSIAPSPENAEQIIGEYPFILVHFPKVRVTNENDKFIDITQLWAKIKILYTGKLLQTFRLNRSEYTASQFRCGYLHSHIIGIPEDSTAFQEPCLGEGPIKGTCASLMMDYDENLWNLFCLELDKYVQVESISGVPYKYLERVSNSSYSTHAKAPSTYGIAPNPISPVHINLFKPFIRFLIYSNKLNFSFIDNFYTITGTLKYNTILISNLFIEWYNKYYDNKDQFPPTELITGAKILRRAVFEDNGIAYLLRSRSDTDFNNHQGSYVCTFKGNKIYLNIVDDLEEAIPCNFMLVLDYTIINFIISSILKLINYKYGRDKESSDNTNQAFTYYL